MAGSSCLNEFSLYHVFISHGTCAGSTALHDDSLIYDTYYQSFLLLCITLRSHVKASLGIGWNDPFSFQHFGGRLYNLPSQTTVIHFFENNVWLVRVDLNQIKRWRFREQNDVCFVTTVRNQIKSSEITSECSREVFVLSKRPYKEVVIKKLNKNR